MDSGRCLHQNWQSGNLFTRQVDTHIRGIPRNSYINNTSPYAWNEPKRVPLQILSCALSKQSHWVVCKSVSVNGQISMGWGLHLKRI